MAPAAEFPVSQTAPEPLLPRVVCVHRRRGDAPRVWTLELQAAGEPQPPFAAGQFNMLTAFGVGEVPISFSGDPAAPQRLVHTVRAVGPVSEALVRLEAGAPLGVRGPYGKGWPLEAADGRDVLLVAGGLGLAPLRPALYQLLAQRERHGRITLLYGTRSPRDILFRRELAAWGTRGDLALEVTVDHATTPWQGHVGVVTALIAHARFDPQRTLALLCGPEIMMRFTAEALCAAGVAPEAIHLSMERSMKCGVGTCGHCQFGGYLLCRDGPVLPYALLRAPLRVREL